MKAVEDMSVQVFPQKVAYYQSSGIKSLQIYIYRLYSRDVLK